MIYYQGGSLGAGGRGVGKGVWLYIASWAIGIEWHNIEGGIDEDLAAEHVSLRLSLSYESIEHYYGTSSMYLYYMHDASAGIRYLNRNLAPKHSCCTTMMVTRERKCRLLFCSNNALGFGIRLRFAASIMLSRATNCLSWFASKWRLLAMFMQLQRNDGSVTFRYNRIA